MDFSFDNVTIRGGFWADMQKKNREVTIPAVYARFSETGRIKGLSCCRFEDNPEAPHIFWDSDVAKWLEGAAYVLAKHPDPKLEALCEDIINTIAAHQWEDGYINSHFTAIEPDARFTERMSHELYTAGHLIEAGVAYYCATGRDKLLKCVERFVDLIDRIFRVDQSAPFLTPGHQEIELALVRLYKCTGNEKYRDLAAFFLDKRGNNDKDVPEIWDLKASYTQSDKPVRELSEAVGHAVRAGYLYTGMADMATITGDEELRAACHRLYDDITNHKMFITGGVGTSPKGEAYTVAYDLPSETAYSETCAAISLAFFSQRLLEAEGESKYADTVERVLYNGFMSGLSLSGDAFFYENPLSIHLRNRVKDVSVENGDRFPITERKVVFDCSCCPPNVNRVLASLERYVSRIDGDTVFIDQFADSAVTGDGFSVEVKTDYPVNGEIRVACRGVGKLGLRIPGWCRKFTLSAPYVMKKGYAVIESPDEVTLTFDMTPVLYEANPEISDCAGRIAVMRGPVVYAYEAVDNGGYIPERYRIDRELNAEVGGTSFCGIPTLTVNGAFIPERAELYSPAGESDLRPARIKLIPYFAFANRGSSDMAVWMLLI